MKRKLTPISFLVMIALLFLGSPVYALDLGGAATSTLKTTGINLAGSLAEYFGVPASAVTSLFDSGLSLESVVQALLISQSAKTSVSKVSNLLKTKKNDVTAVADSLGVNASAYASDKVNDVISKVSGSAGEVKGTVDAVQGTVDAFSMPK